MMACVKLNYFFHAPPSSNGGFFVSISSKYTSRFDFNIYHATANVKKVDIIRPTPSGIINTYLVNIYNKITIELMNEIATLLSKNDNKFLS